MINIKSTFQVFLLILVSYQALAVQNNNASQELFYKRQVYQQLFLDSYQKYPNIPKGTLESLAFVATRWQHRVPRVETAENGMPQTYGVFGLYHTGRFGFIDLVKEISDFNQISVETFLSSESIYVDSVSNYIANQITDEKALIESIDSVLKKMSGISDKNEITRFAINSYVFEILKIQNTGISLKGIQTPPREVNFGKVFSEQQLHQLKSPFVKINQQKSKVNEVDYPGALWVPAANFSSRNGRAIDHITIHTMQGTYAGTIVYFQDPATQASAHYMIRSSDGQITQMVREADKAWHVRNSNPYTIGLEHEGYVDNRDWYTEEMLTESAKLSVSICEVYSIDCSQAYAGESHEGVVTLSEDFTIKGHQHYPDQTHTDPGINWDWPYYYGLVNGAVSPNRFPEASFTTTCTELLCDLDGSASNDIDGSISSYDWDFGDGSVANGQITSHTYSNDGRYNLTLTVTDDSGATNQSTLEVVVAKKIVVATTEPSGGGAFYSYGLFVVLFLFRRRNLSKTLNLSRRLYWFNES